MQHIAFTFPSVSDLLMSYRQRLQSNIRPCWCVHHGITASIYYKDPDGNMLETQFDIFENPDDATAFMKSPEAAQNPYGVDFDPEEWIEKLKGGATDDDFKKRIEIGARDIFDVPAVSGKNQYEEVMAKRAQAGTVKAAA